MDIAFIVFFVLAAMAGNIVLVWAIRKGSQPEAAMERCRKLDPNDPWLAECFFLITDTLEATGTTAREMCALTGRFTCA